jgi:DNA-directed RNA polymerase subunit alpha
VPEDQNDSATSGSAIAHAPAPRFDLRQDEIPSFAFLQAARRDAFRTQRRLSAFTDMVLGLGETGDEGRRKGFGLWMIGRYEEAARLLADHEDDVASFTRANALMAVDRAQDALPIFERLSGKHPKEPRPRAGMIESRLETELAASGDEGKAAQALEEDLAAVPGPFHESAEGLYLKGRLHELRREWEPALDCYERARALDSHHRRVLFRLGHLAERCGLDEEAIEAYQTLCELLPIDRNVLLNLGVLYEDLGQDQDAASCYDTVVKTRPADRQARLYLEDAKAGMQMYYDEDLERKEDRLNQILRIPITDFELSVRARNCLNKMNILTLGDLVKKSEQELLSYKNFGETSLQEIKDILGSKGLRLGMAREEARMMIESSNRRYVTGDNVEAMNKAIQELELSIRARRTVEALGCLTLGDIVQHSEDELLGMPNFGHTSLQELKDKLAEHGLALRAKEGKGGKKAK